MLTELSHETEEYVETEKGVGTGSFSALIVHNDDVNTFDWVIECLIEILQHTQAQAEQLSLLIHFKGKATVKTDSFEALKPKKDALIDRGLSAVIEEIVS
ncbi:MAG: ATP-dependent Clp protease adaptor ClpS [Saprospiraceae bacterium]|nr:ATP-dependent Clp protease adaptor ClpS [Saprospiraceae bacterium]